MLVTPDALQEEGLTYAETWHRATFLRGDWQSLAPGPSIRGKWISIGIPVSGTTRLQKIYERKPAARLSSFAPHTKSHSTGLVGRRARHPTANQPSKSNLDRPNLGVTRNPLTSDGLDLSQGVYG